jgi:hypothetical protein
LEPPPPIDRGRPHAGGKARARRSGKARQKSPTTLAEPPTTAGRSFFGIRRFAMVLVKTPPQPDYGTEVDDGDLVNQPATNARQGVTEHNVRYVLAASLAGIVAIFGLIYLFFFGA